MRTFPPFASLLGLLLLLPVVSLASVLGLELPPPAGWIDLSADGAEISIDQVEVVEDSLAATGTPLDADAHLRLARLFLRSERRELRDQARDHARRAQELAPDRLDAVLLEAQILVRDASVQPSLDRLAEFLEVFPDQPDYQYAIGYYQYQRGKQIVDRERFIRARHAFLRAARLGEGTRAERLALAMAAHLAFDPEAVLAATGKLLEWDPQDGPASLLRACALVAEGRLAEAHPLFENAIAQLAPEVRAEFETAPRFLAATPRTNKMAPSLYWLLVDDRPTQLWNPRKLRYWRRLVESDLIFGRPDAPGWYSSPGEVWVRWGPPLRVIFSPFDPMESYAARTRPGMPPFASSEEELGQSPLAPIGPLDTLEDEPIPMSFRVGYTRMEAESHLWWWVYRGEGGQPVVLGFTNTAFNFDWTPTGPAMQRVEARLAQAPLLFPERTPATTFELDVAAAGYFRGDGQSGLETAVSILPSGGVREVDWSGDDGATVRASHLLRWALYDEDGRRIDHREVPMDGGRLRSRLLKGPSGKDGDPLLWQSGAMLKPGSYRVAVEAEDLSTGSRKHTVMEVALGRRPRSGASMSDLNLVDSFLDYEPGAEVPLEFVKHARVLIPHPRRVITDPERPLYLYYELYDLATDSTARTDFDVVYRILRESDAKADEDAAPLELVEQRAVFTHERLVPSSEGLVVKGTELELSRLVAGRYRLRVVVKDHVGGARLVRDLGFVVDAGSEGS